MKTRAFTLVELLTVIAIIGVLALIVFPIIGKIRENANTTKCMSNLRQIGMATSLHVNDKGAYPTITGNIPWTNVLHPYLSTQSIALPSGFNSNIYSPHDVVMCPSVTLPRPDDAYGYPRSYSANPNIIFSTTATGNANRAPVRAPVIQRPAKIVLFIDGCQGNSGTTNSAALLSDMTLLNNPNAANTPVSVGPDADGVSNNAYPRFRHKGSAQAVMADGSVQTFAKGVLTHGNFSIAY